MRIAITGGTGFVGRHLARALVEAGHEVVLIARGVDCRDESVRHLDRTVWAPVGIDAIEPLASAFAGCDAVAHCAGISRETGSQTFGRVHVEGTRNVVEAARRAGVRKLLLVSFLRARPGCGSPYHESKWAAEEIVRSSGLDDTVLKAGVIYGPGDQMLDRLAESLRTFPVFPLVGLRDRPVRPLAVEDLVRIIRAALLEGRLSRRTVAVVGPETLSFRELVRRVARVLGRRPLLLPLPVAVHQGLAVLFEGTMTTPLITKSQVRMLAEGLAEQLPTGEPPPDDLAPRLCFTEEQIRRGLPDAKSSGLPEAPHAAPDRKRPPAR